MSQIVPLSGAIPFTLIDQLTGTLAGVPSQLPPPFRLSKFGGQDITIPVAPNPIKFSDFRGARNYSNYTFLLTNIGYNSITSTARSIYYRENQHYYGNPYSVVYLGDISTDLVFKTRSASVTGTTTVIQPNADITISMSGYLDADVTLWMQINNDEYAYPTTVQSTETITLSNASTADILDALNLRNNTVAPQIIATNTGDTLPDPFITNSTDFNAVQFTTQANVLTQLTNYANSLPTGTTYTASIALNENNQTRTTIQRVTYNTTNYPLCYGICRAHHAPRKQGWSGASATINVAQYGVKQGDYLRFYMGPGPSTPRQGHIWGSFSLTLTVTNSSRLVF